MTFFPLLIFLTFLTLAITLNWLIPRQSYKKRQKLAQTLAAQRGWTFLANPAYDRHLIYLLVNQDNQPNWELVGTKSRSTGGRNQLPAGNRWHTETTQLTDDKVVIGPVNSPALAKAITGRGFTGFMINFVLAPYGVGDLSGLAPQMAGSTLFIQRFFCLSQQEETARQIINPTIEAELLKWPPSANPHHQPWIVIDSQGITIRSFDNRPETETARLDQLVQLGLAFKQATATFHSQGNRV